MSKEYKNESDLINGTLASAIESGLLEFAESFYNNYRSLISTQSHELRMVMYNAMRDTDVDKITFAIKIGIPLEDSIHSTVIRDANIDVFKVIFDAYPEGFFRDLVTGGSATAFAIKEGRADIANFLDSKGVKMKDDEISVSSLIYSLKRDFDKDVESILFLLRQPIFKRLTADDLPASDGYYGKGLGMALIHHKNYDLLDAIAKTPMFADLFYSQDSINAAYFYGCKHYIDYVKKETGRLPKATNEPINNLFFKTNKCDGFNEFIDDQEQLMQVLIVYGLVNAEKISDTQSKMGINLLQLAMKKQASESALLVCTETSLFKEATQDTVSRFIKMVLETPTSQDILNEVINAMPEDFLAKINADEICDNIVGRYKGIDNSCDRVMVAPLLTALHDHLDTKGRQQIMKSILLLSVDAKGQYKGNPSMEFIRDFCRDFRQFAILLDDNGLHDHLKSYSPLEGKSPKQCLAALRQAYSNHSKKKLYSALTLLSVANEKEKPAYINAFGGKDLVGDIAFKAVCEAWGITPLDMISYPINKKTKESIMNVFCCQ